MSTTVTLLQNLTDAITSSITAFPEQEQDLLPPADGISLLDVKNELLLSYLQNLVFLIILRLRHGNNESNDAEAATSTNDDVVRKLVELRVLMERGVRPLENKLRYQIDKVLRAAEDSKRTAALQKPRSKSGTRKTKSQKQNGVGGNDEDNSSDMSNESGEGEDSEATDVEEDDDDEEAQELRYRPNAAAFAQQLRQSQASSSKPSTSKSNRRDKAEAYKPPRITPTAMPTTRSGRYRSPGDDDDTITRRRRKANLVDEYINEEISGTPTAQPSIGSNGTILARGRTGMTNRDREKQRERLAYEESNYTRLAPETKAERRRAKAQARREQRDMFGGEDWTGLGGLGDRINKSVASSSVNKENILERRIKRKRDTLDSPRGDGIGGGAERIGDAFQQRRQVLQDRVDRKRRRQG